MNGPAIRFGQNLLITLACLSLSSLAMDLQAQTVKCCNVNTGEWLDAASAETCMAQPGHVPYSPENTMKVMACMQKTQQQASQIMGQINSGGVPTGMTGVDSSENNEAQPDCCYLVEKSWLGNMPVEACLAKDAQFPDTEAYLVETEICRTPGGVTGGAWDIDEFEDNIPNGGLESWQDENTPEGFASFGLPPGAAQNGQFDMQTVFQIDDAHTGELAARLKNFDMTAAIREMGVPVMVELPNATTPAGIISCKSPCPLQVGAGAGKATVAQATIPINEVKSHVCGAYRGFISPRDQLSVTVALARGDKILGGTDSGTTGASNFNESKADWYTFALPFNVSGGSLDSANGVSVSAQIQPRNLLQTVQATGLVGSVSKDTRVDVDSFHFCDPVNLTIFKPRVIGISGNVAIDAEQEELPGAQTFVNLDNDDHDAYFDYEDPDGVKEDDELVRLNMRLPMQSKGKVRLNIDAAEDAIKVWQDENKTVEFEYANKDVEVATVFSSGSGSSSLSKDLWLEVLKPSRKQADIKIEFVFTPREAPDDPIKDKVSLTGIGIESIQWKGKANSFEDKDELDADPNWPDLFAENSQRVFPGKRMDGKAPEAEARNKVDVEVTLNVAPVRPLELRFRALDVDDPSADEDEVDNENDVNDNRGEIPAVYGGFPAEPGKSYLTVKFEEQKETFAFQVTMQPGDNFRLVGGGDIMTLMELENDDRKLAESGPRHTMKIVDANVFEATQSPGKAQVREHEKYTSDVLTVWRKLYLEVDTMGPVKGNTVKGDLLLDYVEEVNNESNGNRFLIKLDRNLYQSLPPNSKSGDLNGMVNAYQGGTLTFTGWSQYAYQVILSTAESSGEDSVTLVYQPAWGNIDDTYIKLGYTLVDDDQYQDDDLLPPIPMSRLEPAFEPAYVLPVEGALPNPEPVVPFRLHYTRDDQDYLREVYAFNNEDFHEDPDIWIVYLLNGFQGMLLEDGDGTEDKGAIAGQADGDAATGRNGQGAVIYQESGLELQQSNVQLDLVTEQYMLVPGYRLKDAPPHEIGHLFGGAHTDKGLMDDRRAHKTEDFSPVSLDKIRSRDYP